METTKASIGADGSVMVQTDVAAQGTLGGMQIDHTRVVAAVEGAGRLARAVWSQLDDRGQVRQVSAAVAVPDANGKLYVMRSTGNSSRLPMGTPTAVVAPDPAALLRREDVGTTGPMQMLAVSLKRAFADHGALSE